MMRNFTFITGAAVLLIGMLGCVPDPGDPFTTLSTTLSTTVSTSNTGDGDGDGTETGTATAGDGDGAPGDGDGDGDPGCPPGTFGCPCDNGMCDAGLTCDMTNTCALGGGDGDGDPTGGDPCTSEYDPNACAPPAAVLMVQDLEGNFCSCPCTADADCPAGPAGTQGACALSTMGGNPEFCALICDPANDTCPAGSTCKEVPSQPGVGLCTYP